MNNKPKEELLTVASLAHYQRIALQKLGTDKFRYQEMEWLLHIQKTIVSLN